MKQITSKHQPIPSMPKIRWEGNLAYLGSVKIGSILRQELPSQSLPSVYLPIPESADQRWQPSPEAAMNWVEQRISEFWAACFN